MSLVYGVAINDADYAVRITHQENGKAIQDWICPFYKTWFSMLTRCYSESYKKNYANNYECTISKEWLKFSNFKSWMESQDWVGKQLDKDILIPFNKEYSPTRCVFVSQELNKFFNLHKNRKSKTMIGVTKNCRGSRYTSCISIKGKTKSLGGFPTEIDAHMAWISEKIVELSKFICNDGSRLDNRLLEIKKTLELHYESKNHLKTFKEKKNDQIEPSSGCGFL